MTRASWRSKLAVLIVLFFVGTFAGQLRDVLESVRGRVEAGTRITEAVRDDVGRAENAAANTVDVVGDLTNQVADLQAKLAAGTATPEQVESLRALVGRLRAAAGPAGTPGPAGPAGPPGPSTPAPPPSTASSTTTTRGGAPPTTRPPTTTTTRPPTTTTTRCAVGLGRLVRIGC